MTASRPRRRPPPGALLASMLSVAVACAVGTAPPSASVGPAAQSMPRAPVWIWDDGPPRGAQTLAFRRSFHLDGAAGSLRLVATADNVMTVWLDGEQVLTHADWSLPAAALVDGASAGKHVLAVQVLNEGGPAGLLLQLDAALEGGGTLSVVTDPTWRVAEDPPSDWRDADFDDGDWAAAQIVGELGGAPWNVVDGAAIQRAAPLREVVTPDVADLSVRDGFTVERLHAATPDQGSWVSACLDDAGRLWVSDQWDGGLRRLTVPAPGEDGPVLVERVDLDLSGCQGMTWLGGALYATGRRPSDGVQGLFRADDTDGDGEPDGVVLLTPLSGAGEHGWHAVLPTPDGRSLIVVAGNQTQRPEGHASRVPTHWGEDALLRRLPDPHGFMTGVLAPGGCVYRVSLDGARWELLSTGYRNPYDAAFSDEGELFTFDADMEWDLGAPWYRPTRVLLAASGSDYGWRNGSGKWSPQGFDSPPVVHDVGLGSPVGVVSGAGAGFPAPYDRALFLADWSYGRVFAAQLVPDGGGWRGDHEVFLSGRPLPVTDLVVHPQHRALYLVTGGRSTRGGLYRVTASDPGGDVARVDAAPGGAASRAPGGAGSRIAGELDAVVLRARRRELEALHVAGAPPALDVIWPALGDPDPWVRHAGRVALEWQPVDRWRDRALVETQAASARAALLALARVSADDPLHRAPDAPPPDPERGREIVDALLRLDAAEGEAGASADHAARVELLRALAVTLARFGPPAPPLRDRLRERFGPRLPSGSPATDLALVELLVFLQSEDVAAPALDLLERAPSQEQQIGLAAALCRLEAGWTPTRRARWFDWLGRARAFGGGTSIDGFLARIEALAWEHLDDDARAAAEARLAATPRPASPLAAWRAPLAGRVTTHPYTVDDVVAAAQGGLDGADVARGRTLFGATGCFACHRVAGEGGAVGPDLTGAGARFSLHELARSLVDPSETISDQYETVNAFLDDGEVISGRIVNLNGHDLHLGTDMFDPGAIRVIDRRRIERLRPSAVSAMPAGLLDLLTTDEVRDLVAFTLSGGVEATPDDGG